MEFSRESVVNLFLLGFFFLRLPVVYHCTNCIEHCRIKNLRDSTSSRTPKRDNESFKKKKKSLVLLSHCVRMDEEADI